MAELTSKTIAELRDGFRGGEFSAREIAEAYNAAVVAARTLNAFTVETPEDALAAAEAADKARGSGDFEIFGVFDLRESGAGARGASGGLLARGDVDSTHDES